MEKGVYHSFACSHYGYRQVTSTLTSTEWPTPTGVNFLSACSQCVNIGGILMERTRAKSSIYKTICSYLLYGTETLSPDLLMNYITECSPFTDYLMRRTACKAVGLPPRFSSFYVCFYLPPFLRFIQSAAKGHTAGYRALQLFTTRMFHRNKDRLFLQQEQKNNTETTRAPAINRRKWQTANENKRA